MKHRIIALARRLGLIEGYSPYNEWAHGTIQGASVAHSHHLTATWEPGSEYWPIVVRALDDAEALFVKSLLQKIKNLGVPGVIAEFGVFEGRWLKTLADLHDDVGLGRDIYGFDSFEGLPAVSATDDLNCWQEGQYKADFESVSARLRCAERKHVHLVKGWFSDSLKRADIQSIDEIAFARVDCDLYQPTVEVLDFIKPRLPDGAILVFDDWTWNLEKGETKAFAEWCRVSGLQFSFLASTMGHYYLQVRKP